jgi:ribosomal protein L11 methyltransferase
MLELCPTGFEERDGGDDVEFAAYTSRDGEERFRRVFRDADAVDVAPGWDEAWKRFHRPVRIGALWVGPPWQPAPADATAVVIDPGRAFGTGAHPTTRLCLELLLGCERTSLLDLGCGSGVLAIAGAKLGFVPVTALDSDPAAVEATTTNAAANGVAVDVRRADAATDVLPEAEIAVANIDRETLERVVPRLRSQVLIASGYPVAESPAVAGWRRDERLETAGWAADRYVRL